MRDDARREGVFHIYVMTYCILMLLYLDTANYYVCYHACDLHTSVGLRRRPLNQLDKPAG